MRPYSFVSTFILLEYTCAGGQQLPPLCTLDLALTISEHTICTLNDMTFNWTQMADFSNGQHNFKFMISHWSQMASHKA